MGYSGFSAKRCFRQNGVIGKTVLSILSSMRQAWFKGSLAWVLPPASLRIHGCVHKTVVTLTFAFQNGVKTGRKLPEMSRAEFVFVGNTASGSSKVSQNQQEISHFAQNWIHKWTLYLEKTPIGLRENDQKVRKNALLDSSISTRIGGLGCKLDPKIGAIWVLFDRFSWVFGSKTRSFPAKMPCQVNQNDDQNHPFTSKMHLRDLRDLDPPKVAVQWSFTCILGAKVVISGSSEMTTFEQ